MGMYKHIEKDTQTLIEITEEQPNRTWTTTDIIKELNRSKSKQGFRYFNYKQIGKFLKIQDKVKVIKKSVTAQEYHHRTIYLFSLK